MLDILFWIKYVFIFENGFEPKNPRYAENGLGCGVAMIKCLFQSIKFDFEIA